MIYMKLIPLSFLLSKMEGSIGNAINLLARSDKESGFFWAGCLALAAKDANAEVRVKMWLDKINERYLKKASSQPKQKKAQKTQEESKGQENQETKQCPDNQDVDMEITN